MAHPSPKKSKIDETSCSIFLPINYSEMNLGIIIIGVLGFLFFGIITNNGKLPPSLQNDTFEPCVETEFKSIKSIKSTEPLTSSEVKNAKPIQVGAGCPIGVKHVSGWDDDPDNDGISCRRLSRSEAPPPKIGSDTKGWSTASQFAERSPQGWSTASQFAERSPQGWSTASQFAERSPQGWSTISSCGPGIRDPRQYAFQRSLADIYPTMSYQCLNRLPEFLDPQSSQLEIIAEQAKLLDHYRQQVHDLDAEYLRARRAGQKLFENPLNSYQEPLMDPTRPPEKQPVILGIKPNQLHFLGDYSINECGGLDPRLFGGDFILFRNTINPQ